MSRTIKSITTLADSKNTHIYENSEAEPKFNKQIKIKHTNSKIGIVMQQNEVNFIFQQMENDTLPQLKLDLSLMNLPKMVQKNQEKLVNKPTEQESNTKIQQKYSKKNKNKKSKIFNILLVIISLWKLLLFPISYSFSFTLFTCLLQFKYTYKPEIPNSLKSVILLTVQNGMYSILIILYVYYKVKNKKNYFSREKLFVFAAITACFQLFLLVVWIQGWQYSNAIYQRAHNFQFGTTYCSVDLLLKWRFLWIINLTATIVNTLCLLMFLIIKKYVNFN